MDENSTRASPCPDESLQWERRVLGALLKFPELLPSISGLRPDHFFAVGNQYVFSAILAVSEQGLNVEDLLVIRDYLQRADRWGAVENLAAPGTGGLGYLDYAKTLAGNAGRFTRENVQFYVGKVLDAHARRVLLQNLQKHQAGLGNGSSPAEVVEALRRDLEALDGPGADLGDGFGLVEVASVERKPLRWLWPGRFPLGKVSLLAGDPDLGKSLLTLDVAARVSTGSPSPDGGPGGGPAGVILLNAEDDVADTVRPRLEAAGADLTRVLVLQPKGTRHFTLQHDLPQLERALRRRKDVRLLVVDPVSAYLGSIDSHNNAEVRGLLAPLAELASRFGVGVLAVTHLNKGMGGSPMYRATGSLAFTAAARAFWLVAKDPQNPSRKLFLPVKANLSAQPTGLAFSIIASPADPSVPVLAWEREAVTVRAEEALAEPARDGPRAKAVAYLLEELADGPRKANELTGRFSEKTLDRAKKELGVKAVQQRDGWYWELPGGEDDDASSIPF